MGLENSGVKNLEIGVNNGGVVDVRPNDNHFMPAGVPIGSLIFALMCLHLVGQDTLG